MSEAAAKALADVGPPASVSVSGLYLLGVSLPDWVLIVTLALGVGNLYVLVRDKFVRPYLESKKEAARGKQEGGE